MMTTLVAILFYFMLLLLIQKVMIVFLMKGINADLKAMRMQGDLSVGLHRGKLGIKTYAAVCIRDGNIISMKVLRQYTLLSKFKPYPLIGAQNTRDALASIAQNSCQNEFDLAVKNALQQYESA